MTLPMCTFVRERRATRRLEFDGCLRLRVRGASVKDDRALPINLSTGGILLRTNSCLEVGAAVELELAMPERIGGQPAKERRFFGRVIHVELCYLPGRLVSAGIQFHRPWGADLNERPASVAFFRA